MMMTGPCWAVLLLLLHITPTAAKPHPKAVKSNINNVPKPVKNATDTDHKSENTYELRYDTKLDVQKRISVIQTKVQSKSFRNLIGFEAQLAESIKMDPILLLQYGIALWTLANCVLEGTYQERFKIRIRSQTLILVVFSRLIDVYIRMNTLPVDDNKNKNILAGFIDEAVELPNRIYSLQTYNTTSLYKKAKSDVRQLVKDLGSQQIVYSIIVVFSFHGNSALSPLIPITISDIPFLLQFTTIFYNILSANETADKNTKVTTDYFGKFKGLHLFGSTALELLVLMNIIMAKLRNNTENVFIKVIQLLVIGQYTYRMISVVYPKVIAINTKTKKPRKARK